MRIEADAMVRDQGTKTIQDLGYRVHEVLTSGFYDFPPASDLLRELGFEFIQKPFTPTELADRVKSIRSQLFRQRHSDLALPGAYRRQELGFHEPRRRFRHVAERLIRHPPPDLPPSGLGSAFRSNSLQVLLVIV